MRARLPACCEPAALGLLAGALLVVASRIPGAWPLSFVALVPLFAAVARAPSKRAAFLAGFLAGVPMMGAALWWLFDALPLPPAFGDLTLGFSVAMVSASFAVLALGLGALTGLWALYARALLASRLWLPVAALSWPAFEYLRMVAYNIFTFAPDVPNPPFFSAGFIGYALADSGSWLQLAVFGGAYALSAAVALGNALAYRILAGSKERRARYAALFALAILGVHLLPLPAARAALSGAVPRHEISVAALSLRTPADASPAVRGPAEETALAFVRKASDAGADLIALPEESNMFAPFSDRTPRDTLGARYRSAIVDSGTVLREDGTRVRRAHAPDTLGRDSGLFQDKRILAPKGEYLPTLLSGAVTLLGAGDTLDRFAAKRNFSIAEGGRPGIVSGARVSVLLCIEAMQPGSGRRLAREQDSDLLVILASHAWFGDSPWLAQDTFRQARVQAVEAGVPVVRSADFAPAYVFDRYGRIVASGGLGEEPGIAAATLRLP